MSAADFKPMLAKDGDLSKIKFPVVVQPKLDGIRCSIVNGKPVSRTLKPIPNKEIHEALSDPRLEGLDGELIVGEVTASDCYRTTVSFVMSHDKTGEPWVFHVFDKWDEPGGFWNRFSGARKTIFPEGASLGLCDRVCIVTTSTALDSDHLEQIEEFHIDLGHEGIIVRVGDAPYKFGRSGKAGPLLKVKRFVDFEAEVIGVYEEMRNDNEATTNALGHTERSSHQENKVGKDTLGGLELRAINGLWEGAEFRCGTGFDRATRVTLWRMWHDPFMPEFTAGQVVKVKSFPIGVKDKPRHPVFLGFRDMEVDG